MSHYPQAELVFLSIPNIHVMRDSLNKVRALVDPISPADEAYVGFELG